MTNNILMTYVVDYDMLRYVTNECIEDGANITYHTVQKEARILENSKCSKWCMVTSSTQKGRVHSKCIVFNEGKITAEAYENAKVFYMSTGAKVVALAG